MKQKGFAHVFILVGILVIVITIGAVYYLTQSASKASQDLAHQPVNQSAAIHPSSTPTLESYNKFIPPKIDFKLPEGWQFKKSENPVISKKPLWYSYGDITNTSIANKELSENQGFTISFFFYENSSDANVSGIEEEGVHGGGNSLKYEKPEKIILGSNSFTRQISYPAETGRDYEGSASHSTDDRNYTYSYQINSNFLVIRLYYNNNNPQKDKLISDLDLFLASVKVE
jgi:hypothetical protein